MFLGNDEYQEQSVKAIGFGACPKPARNTNGTSRKTIDPLAVVLGANKPRIPVRNVVSPP
jgi:hypothetical protein